MFEAEGDKKKKVYPACPIYGARRIHHFILWVRIILIDTSRKKITLDAIWIADTNLNMILFSKSRIRIKFLPLPKYTLHGIVRMLVGFCINSSGCLNNSTI